MSIYSEAVANWGLPIPDELESVLLISPSSCVTASDGAVAVPWPPFTPAEVASASSVSGDWDLEANMVPVMGDFHDLVCLVFDSASQPQVIILNDARQVLARFKSIGEFVAAINPSESKPSSQLNIIEQESWLDF